MGAKGKNNKKKRSKTKTNRKTKEDGASSANTTGNFFLPAGPGCHMAHYNNYCHDHDDLGTTNNDWMLGWEQVDPENDFDNEDEIPDIAYDPQEKTLTLCNIRKDDTVVAYISVYEHKLRNRQGQILQQGTSTNNQGDVTRNVTTLIVLCPPCTFAHLCHVDASCLLAENVESDVQVWNQHQHPRDTHPRILDFPLATNDNQTSFLCTQGEGGQLTHFFAGNLHAIDFQCPVGTPLVAVADGVVVEANDENRLTGIAVKNLFQWNSILIAVDDTAGEDCALVSEDDVANWDCDLVGGKLFVEYVHIQTSAVQKGDRVQKGQIIGTSGGVGFSPEPHLHFAAYRSADATAPTVRVFFQGQDDSGAPTFYLPKANTRYSSSGQHK